MGAQVFGGSNCAGQSDRGDSAMALYQLIVPENAPAGTLLMFDGTDGFRYQAPVPHGIYVGQTFTVQIPSLTGEDGEEDEEGVEVPEPEGLSTKAATRIKKKKVKKGCC